MEKDNNKTCYLEWSVNAVVAIILLTVTYKIIFSTESIDSITMLSIMLAFFAIGLSITFYFKTTETSNRFYDNTYRYTKDLAELLNRIESGFGEKLTNLDKHIDSLKYKKLQVEEEVKDEEDEVVRLRKEKDELYQQLLEKSKLSEQEKAKYIEKLKEKDLQLEEKSQALLEAKRRLRMLESRIQDEIPTTEKSSPVVLSPMRRRIISRRVRDYIINEVLPILGRTWLTKSPATIQRTFKRHIDEIHPEALREMRALGYLRDNSDTLTHAGIDMLRSLAQNAAEARDE